MSSTSDDSMKVVKIPVFLKGVMFNVWWRQFNAHATLMKFKPALSPNGDPDMPAREDTVLHDTVGYR